MTPHPPPARRRLTLFLLVYTGFILAGSLFPFSGWRMPDAALLEFLAAPWPRYITRTDLATNLFIYAPLGYALARWFSLPGRTLRGIALALLGGGLLSLSCETAQHALPSRIASNLDLLMNLIGTLLGALLTLHHGRWLRALRALGRWRARGFRPGLAAHLGLALLAAWLVAQFALVPVSGVGWLSLHLRPLDNPPAGLAALNLAWWLALWIELVALGALASCLLRPGRYVGGLAQLFLAAFFAKLLAAAVLLKLSAVAGVLSLETLAAFVLAFWLLLLPAVSRHRLGVALAAMLAIVAARLLLAPDFLPAGSALNIVGLARQVAVWWPVLGLAWLLHAGCMAQPGCRIFLQRRLKRPAG